MLTVGAFLVVWTSSCASGDDPVITAEAPSRVESTVADSGSAAASSETARCEYPMPPVDLVVKNDTNGVRAEGSIRGASFSVAVLTAEADGAVVVEVSTAAEGVGSRDVLPHDLVAADPAAPVVGGIRTLDGGGVLSWSVARSDFVYQLLFNETVYRFTPIADVPGHDLSLSVAEVPPELAPPERSGDEGRTATLPSVVPIGSDVSDRCANSEGGAS